MWKIAASGQIRGRWSYSSAPDDSYIALYFENENDMVFARLVAGNEDLPEDGWVPLELLEGVNLD